MLAHSVLSWASPQPEKPHTEPLSKPGTGGGERHFFNISVGRLSNVLTAQRAVCTPPLTVAFHGPFIPQTPARPWHFHSQHGDGMQMAWEFPLLAGRGW